jgi:hypothetical protein
VIVTEVPNCIDRERTHFSGDRIDRPAFHPLRITRGLFKLPELVYGAPFVAEAEERPEWAFKRLVEGHGLRGIEFKTIWNEGA